MCLFVLKASFIKMKTKKPSSVANAIIYRGIGYVFALVTIPLFARTLTSIEYGELGIAITFCSILQAFCEGGHTILGSKAIVAARSECARRNISTGIYRRKLILLIFSLLIGLIYFYFRSASTQGIALFLLCYLLIVLPDSITPVWVYHGFGRLDDFGRLLFIARALALPVMICLVYLWPNKFSAAGATGVPFLIFALLTVMNTTRELPARALDILKRSTKKQSFNTEWRIHLGSIASITYPAIVMQTISIFNYKDDLGSVYLTISIWVACRQLCIIPNQAAFFTFASRTLQAELARKALFSNIAKGVIIAATISLTLLLAGQHLVSMAFGTTYVGISQSLALMIALVMIFVISHGLTLNVLAANGKNSAFLYSHLIAVTMFIVCYSNLSTQTEIPLRLLISLSISDFSSLVFSSLMVYRLRLSGN